MTPSPTEQKKPTGQLRMNGLSQQARLRGERRARFQREGERPIARNLALMGSLGWLIVIPALLGIAAGVWLDRSYGTGVFWSGALLVAGLALGCWMAWQRVTQEQEDECRRPPQ
jgi:ATP synthase protein I